MVRSLSPSDLFAMSGYGANVDGIAQGDSGVMASTKQLLAPNGESSNLNPLQWEQVRTPEFKKWFGDWENDPENASKVVDSNGEPRPVFHGSDAEFNTFKKPEINRMAQRSDVGFWFTTGRQETERYGKGVKEVFLNIRNPKSITTRKLDMMAVSEPMAKVIPKLKRGKVDGLSIPEVKEDKMMGEKYTPVEYVVFNANQIKSATDNTGEFNPDNPDIRFSLRDSVDEINSSIREAFSPRQGKQSLGWLAGLFQRNHLIDFVAKELPMLEAYKTLSQEKDNTINKAEREIAEHYEKMKNSMTHDVMNELGRVQGLATRLKDFDPAKFDDSNPTQADINALSRDEKEVYQDYKALPDNAKKAYKMMREDYKSDLLAKKSALIQRLNAFPIDRETKAEIIKQIELHFDQAIKKGVYFPLSRNGDTVVTADKLDDDGNIIPSESIVEFTESGKATDKLMAELKERGYKNRRVDKKAVYIRSLATTNAANNIAALATKAIADLKTNIQQQGAEDILDFSGFTARDIIEGGDFNQLLSDFNQQLIDALPDTSYRKHFIHRKGTLGYSTDTLRAYAGTRTAAAKNIASLLYDHKIYSKIQDAKDAIKEMSNGEDDDTRVDSLRSVLNELELREERLKNSSITQASQILTSLGFMGALGFNVASAAVNMLQVPGVTLPELSGKHGFTQAAAEINKAYKLLFNKDVLNKHSGFDLSKHPELNKPQNAPLRAALIKLNEIGKIDLTLTHEAISMGQNPSYSDNAVTRTVGGIGRYSGYLFHVAEALNRQVTGISAFNLAYRKNGGDFDAAFKDAVDVIDRTQFDYSQSNRARYMMSDTARVLTLFKSYALGISYYIGRNVHNAIKGETPEIRLAARKMVATQMAMTFATSGLFGLPIGGEALAVLGGVAGFKYKGASFAVPGAVGGMLLFQMLLAGLGADDEDDVEVQFRNWLTDNFDQTTAEWVVKGPARLLPMGDISSRTGLSDIWWRPQNKELEGKDQYQAFANALLGPLGSQFAGLFTAMKMYQDGAYSRAIESMSPAAIRNIIAAARMENEGVKTIKGDPIVNRDLTMTEIANKVLGFNPTVVTNNYDANTAIAKARDRIAMKKAHLVNRYIASDPQERVDLMRGDIKEFNSEVEPQERITIGSLMKSIRQRKALDRRTENGLYLSKKSEHLRDIGRFGKED